MGLNEIGRRADNGKVVIKIDPRYFRPCEVETLLGDPTKASKELGWEAKTSLEELVGEMIKEDLILAKKEVLILKKGFPVNSPKRIPQVLKIEKNMNLINKNSFIFLAGHKGMVGKAIKESFIKKWL